MADTDTSPFIRISMSENARNAADLAQVIEDINSLAGASLWSAILHAQSGSQYSFGDLAAARRILEKQMLSDEASVRFYPDFHRQLNSTSPWTYSNLTPFGSVEPIDVGAVYGIYSWMSRQILRSDVDLHRRVFSFARFERIEKRSPAVLDFAFISAIGVVSIAALSAILIAVTRKFGDRDKRSAIETDTLAAVRDDWQEIAKQRKLQTGVLEDVSAAIRRQIQDTPDAKLPEGVLTNLSQIAAPSVASIASNPLVDKIEFNPTIGLGGS